ncbi:MAG: hypothetical protein ACRCYX_14365 [Dermatophilaceae bacterium]
MSDTDPATAGTPPHRGLYGADHALSEHRAAMAEIGDLIGEISDLGRQYADELDEFREQMAARDEERAEQARDGLLGADWQRIQRRIDLGQTSLDAVLRGEDTSAEAHELRRTAAENSRTIAEIQEAEPDDPDDDDTGEIFGQVRRQQAEIQELIAQIREIPRPGTL